MVELEPFLRSKGIEFTLHEHAAVRTCEEADRICGDIAGVSSKNLLLNDRRKTRFLLFILASAKRADIERLGRISGAGALSFASEATLMARLGVEPGAVSPFGLANDAGKVVEVYLDREIQAAPIVKFHPNRNTATISLSGAMFGRYLALTGNRIVVIDV